MKQSNRSAHRTITGLPSPRWLSNTIMLTGALIATGCGSELGSDSAARGGRDGDGGCGVGVARAALSTPWNGLSPEVLANFRLFLDFSSSTYDQDPSLQYEMRRGIDIGMRLWQSVLPALRYRWVESRAEANLPIIFGNYQSQAARSTTNCPGGDVFTACAVRPQSGGLPANAAIWFNDAGKSVEPGNIPPFTFDQYTFVSRDRLITGYIPATYPPAGYRRNDPLTAGYIVGQYGERALGESEVELRGPGATTPPASSAAALPK
jgi:hypothetical protein